MDEATSTSADATAPQWAGQSNYGLLELPVAGRAWLRQVRGGTGRIYDALVTWRAMVQRHWPFAILLAAGVALRAAATVAYRPALIYIDTPRYLGGDQGGLDPLGYTYLLLRPPLGAGGGLTGVAVAQHALGLAMAAALYALAIRYGTGRWLAALAAAPVLLDAYQVQAEQTIMPDVLFETLIVAAMTLLLWPRPPVAPGEDSSPRAALARVACGAVLLGVSATVRQVGVLFVVPLLAYVLTAGPGWPSKAWRNRAMRAFAALALFAVPVIGYMAFSAGRARHRVPAIEHERRVPVRPARVRGGLRHAQGARLRSPAVPGARHRSKAGRRRPVHRPVVGGLQLPAPKGGQPGHGHEKLRPGRAHPAAAPRRQRHRRRRDQGVRAHQGHRPRRPAHSPLAVPGGLPRLPGGGQIGTRPERRTAGNQATGRSRSAATSSTAGTHRARCCWPSSSPEQAVTWRAADATRPWHAAHCSPPGSP